jgi:geranylgeranyl reductase family protein
MERYDCLICGAGPSGSTAAKYLAEKGLDVLVLEKGTFPRDKPCGGALRPSIIEEFDHIKKGIKTIPYTKCLRAKMYAPSLENFVDYRPNKVVMYNIQRMDFDMLLANYAKDAGAQLLENEEISKVNFKDNGIEVRTKSGFEAQGKMIIGAGGMHDPVARYLRNAEGLPEKWPRSEIGLSIVEEYEVDDDFIKEKYGEERTCYFHLKPDNLYGYSWVFSKANALNIGYGAFWNDIKKVNIKKNYSQYLAFLQKEGLIPNNLHPSNPKGALIPLRGAIKTTFTDRILLTGDAAGFVSPVGGDGIYFAIDSGRIAADVVAKACENGDFSKNALSSYQDQWSSRWGRDLKVLCYFADKIFNKTEKVLRYASKDLVFQKMAVSLYNGEISAYRLKPKIQLRAARDFILYDVFRKN